VDVGFRVKHSNLKNPLKFVSVSPIVRDKNHFFFFILFIECWLHCLKFENLTIHQIVAVPPKKSEHIERTFKWDNRPEPALPKRNNRLPGVPNLTQTGHSDQIRRLVELHPRENHLHNLEKKNIVNLPSPLIRAQSEDF
jgi:hypothetical protein